MAQPINNTLFILTGPTSSGKSEIIHQLGREYPIEVLSADSGQIYRGMPIGTAQPSLKEQREVTYHMVGTISPNETHSAGSFVKYCKAEIPRIRMRGNIPFVSGGTYFYIDALLHGLLNEPPLSDEIKARVNSFSASEIKEELKKRDSVSLKKIHPNNLQRLKRALLISIAADQPFSSFQREGGVLDEYHISAWVIDITRDQLYKKINAKTKQMFASGWIQEVLSLIQEGYGKDSPGLKRLGYPEIIQFLESCDFDLSKISTEKYTLLIEKVAQKTRNFAKRQITWFSQQKILKKIDHTQTKKSIVNYIKKIGVEREK